MRRGRRGVLGLLALGVAGVVASCSLPEAQPDLTRYYLLTPVEATAPAPDVTAAVRRVLLRRVQVPEFLRGKIMPVRLSENELKFVDEARWAEPLEAGLSRTLAVNLERGERVRLVERGGEPADFEIALHVRQCEGVVRAGAARLAARIEVYSGGLDPKLVASDEFSTDVTGWDGEDHGELAKKLSEAVGRLAERVTALLPQE